MLEPIQQQKFSAEKKKNSWKGTEKKSRMKKSQRGKVSFDLNLLDNAPFACHTNISHGNVFRLLLGGLELEKWSPKLHPAIERHKICR